MNRLAYLSLWCFLLTPTSLAQDGEPHAKDRESIIQNIVSYVDAFNARDAKSMAEHWSNQGQWLNPETGQRVVGQAAIARELQAQMTGAEDEGGKLSVSVESIRFVTSSVAVEEGVATNSLSTNSIKSTYTAIHVKEDGAWKLDSVRETMLAPPSSEPSAPGALATLQWMTGDWTDDAPDSSVETSCKWTRNRSFMTRSFRVVTADNVALEGTQVIGWDPQRSVIRSWMFDSDGSFGEAVWTPTDTGWEIAATQTLADGGSASSTNIINIVDSDTFTWQSIKRKINGVAAPDVEPFRVGRKQ